MTISLDHIFIITEPEAAEADRLLEVGFVEGNSNVHPGQGTSNRRFFLNGFTVELLYISDADEAANGAGKKLGILTRSKKLEASPFGIVVRVTEANKPSFPSWQYVPDYFDGKMCFYVGDNFDQLDEPLCICMPQALPKAATTPAEYANPGWHLSSLEIDVPTKKPSEALLHFAAMERVQINFDKPHKMVLTFNNGAEGRSKDLTPELPLVLNW